MTRLALFLRDLPDATSVESLPFWAIAAAVSVLLALFVFPPSHPPRRNR